MTDCVHLLTSGHKLNTAISKPVPVHPVVKFQDRVDKRINGYTLNNHIDVSHLPNASPLAAMIRGFARALSKNLTTSWVVAPGNNAHNQN